MKTVKLTVLFKSGVEKSYIIHDMTDKDIEHTKDVLRKYVGSISIGAHIALDYANIILALNEIVSVEFEILE